MPTKTATPRRDRTSGGGAERPVTARGERTRTRIIAAARAVFEERGFIDTRVAHITARARVAYGSFYTYFPSKEAVFLEVADHLFTEMTRGDPLPPAGPGPAARVRRANRAYYEAYRRNAKLMAIIEQVATFHAEFRELRRRHRAELTGRSAHAIAGWQRAGLVHPDLDPEMTARALSAMIDHSLYLWLVQGEDTPDTRRLLDTLDALTLNALGLTS